MFNLLAWALDPDLSRTASTSWRHGNHGQLPQRLEWGTADNSIRLLRGQAKCTASILAAAFLDFARQGTV